MNNISIRTYEDSDWLAICRIHDKARPIELDGSCDKNAFVPLENEKDELENIISSKIYVACIKDRIVGFAGVRDCVITWLYVDPSEFGKGIGRFLLRYVLEKIHGKAITYVLDGNQTARRLYQSEGFKISKQFDSNNNGYPCTVLKLTKQPFLKK